MKKVVWVLLRPMKKDEWWIAAWICWGLAVAEWGIGIYWPLALRAVPVSSWAAVLASCVFVFLLRKEHP